MLRSASTARLRGPHGDGVRGAAALTCGGAAYACAALWAPWAIDGPARGVAAAQDGWAWMLFGDALMMGGLVLLLLLAASLWLDPPARGRTARVGVAALLLIALMGAVVAVVWWLTGTDFPAVDPARDARAHVPGPGPGRALIGLGVASISVLYAMHARRFDEAPGPHSGEGPRVPASGT